MLGSLKQNKIYNYPNYWGTIRPETEEEIQLYNKLKESFIPSDYSPTLEILIRKDYQFLLKPDTISWNI